MNAAPTNGTKNLHLPKLAAMAIIFLGLSTNARLDAAPVWQLQGDLPPHEAKQAKPKTDNTSIRVLSDKDMALYKAAFAAQEVGDWKFADDSLEQVSDKRLVGHVLADRYLKRDFTLDEIKGWLAIYSDNAQAPKLYARAKKLSGFSNTYIRPPKANISWSGSNGAQTTSGFRNINDNDDLSEPKARIIGKISGALRKGDPHKAREILNSELQRGALSTTEAGDIIGRIAATFYYGGDIERARSMAQITENSPQGLWIMGLSAWKKHDFGSAAQTFATLAQTKGLSSWDQAAAFYWTYRATSRLGDKKQSYFWLSEAAQYPQTFYGALAGSLMGHKPARPWEMPELNPKRAALLSSTPTGWQALALVQVGRNDLAESELRRIIQNSSPEMRTAVLALSGKAYLPSLTMQLGNLAGNDNGRSFDAALFPLPPWEPKEGFKVDRALIYAVMRHESRFDPTAISSRGACGLMQIMPSTARQISNDNEAYRSSRSLCPQRLMDPAHNMTLGQKYVRILSEQPWIGDNLLLLLAAYNGGPGNVARWLGGTDRTDPLFFIESLPVRETRDYVQQVLLQYWMYRSRLSQPETTLAQLAHGEWPRYKVHEQFVKQADAQRLELSSIR